MGNTQRLKSIAGEIDEIAGAAFEDKIMMAPDMTFTTQVTHLRNARLPALLFALTVICVGYAAPAGATEKGKVVEVPASTRARYDA